VGQGPTGLEINLGVLSWCLSPSSLDSHELINALNSFASDVSHPTLGPALGSCQPLGDLVINVGDFQNRGSGFRALWGIFGNGERFNVSSTLHGLHLTEERKVFL
jgi:hypothetical protein